MGYYTRFELGFDSTRSDRVELDRFQEDQANGVRFGSYDLPLDDSSWETMKWYEHEKDMKELSAKYPNVLFVLTGEGEETGDMWREYYMNGDVQRTNAVVSYPEPDYDAFRRVDLRAKRAAELEARRQALLAEQARVQAELDKLK